MEQNHYPSHQHEIGTHTQWYQAERLILGNTLRNLLLGLPQMTEGNENQNADIQI